VLVVDDDPAKRLALRAVVAPLGYSVVEAASGAAALQCVAAQDFAVILLDVLMPVMDGLETAAAIRRQSRSALTPIIFITAFADSDLARTDFFAQGAVDFIHAPVVAQELQAKVSVFAGLYANAAELSAKARTAEESASRLERLNVELATIARRDPLTGLRNRRALSEDLEMLEARVRRYAHRYCMAVTDVDYFKSYNDAFGHQAGDEVLQAVAARLIGLLRTGDSVYRYGGEEFLCVFAEQGVDSGVTAVERLRAGVQALGIPHPASPEGMVTLSAGVAILDARDGWSASQVLKAADDALYDAKRLGRNRVEYAAFTGSQAGDLSAGRPLSLDRGYVGPVESEPREPSAMGG